LVDRLRRVPAWGWLAAIVVISFAFRAWLARGMVAPFILVDELIYAELARSLADSGERLVRDVPTTGYGIGYPLLIAPAYALFEKLPDAYAAVKTINALLMSLAAVPAYLLARRLVGDWWALGAAVLAVAIPSMAYTGTVMTENAFYPLFLLIAWQLARVLARPTAAGQVLLLALIAVAYTIRVQALVLVPAALTAPVLLALFERRRSTLRPFLAAYGIVVAGGAALVALQLARGHDLSELLGAYSVVGEGDYDVRLVLDYLVWHLAELDLYLAVLPVAATLLLLANVGSLPRRYQEHLAVTVAVTSWLALAVAAFASRFAANRIQERNLFVVAPLLLICLVAWVERGAPRPRAAVLAAAVTAALAPLLIPYERFIETGVVSDTLALIPLWRLYGNLIADSVDWTVAVAGVALGCLFVLVPQRWAPALPAIVLVVFALVFLPVWWANAPGGGAHGFKTASAGALFQGIQLGDRDWIDEATHGRPVSVLWTGVPDRFVVNENEFFNRSVGPVYTVGAPTPGGLAETPVTKRMSDGTYRTAEGKAVRGPYVLVHDSIAPDGVAVGRDPGRGMTVWRVDGPLVATTTTIKGLYPGDTWSGKSVIWTRQRCRGGTLVAAITSDPALFRDDQIVTASIGGRPVARTRVPPVGERILTVRTRPDGGMCRVVFEVARTRVPGGGDTRQLGAHFSLFYRP
jgi:4-amino-4-deoxy-L-arabinose transferase-like glycosyltransferase